MMDMTTALQQLGVQEDTLTPVEQNALDEQGFLVLRDMLTPAQISTFITRLDDLVQQEGEDAGKEAHQEEGAIRLADLINKDPMFQICFTHPRILAAANHVLQNGFKVTALNARYALPGQGDQMLHADWGPENPSDWDAVKAGHYCGMNSLWLLEDYTPDNGATRIVPGTHKSYRMPEEVMTDPREPYPDEVLLLAPAGTVIAFNSHCWHGGTLNRTSGLRRVLHMGFIPRHRRQLTNQHQHLRTDTSKRITPAMTYMLGL